MYKSLSPGFLGFPLAPLGLLFLEPRPRRSWKTAGPGTQFLPGCKRCIEASSLKFAWCGVFLQEMLSNVWQTQTFAVGTNWRELVQKQQATSRWKVLCEHPRYVHFENIVIATFEYFKNGLEDFYMLWDIYLAKQATDIQARSTCKLSLAIFVFIRPPRLPE